MLFRYKNYPNRLNIQYSSRSLGMSLHSSCSKIHTGMILQVNCYVYRLLAYDPTQCETTRAASVPAARSTCGGRAELRASELQRKVPVYNITSE
jgi:hypothetical protein